MKLTRVSDLKDGMIVRGRIRQTKFDRGEIVFEDGRFYLCQDVKEGEYCDDRRGYNYSWVLPGNSRKNISDYSVYDLELVKNTLNVGDTVIDTCGDPYTINGIGYYKVVDEYGEILFITMEEMIHDEWNLDPIEEKTEMTIAEIEEKLGHSIKIVKEK